MSCQFPSLCPALPRAVADRSAQLRHLVEPKVERAAEPAEARRGEEGGPSSTQNPRLRRSLPSLGVFFVLVVGD
ncbi:hypothetical protein U9M48_027560 [Paspalum notatum var. saurae]|uniref:Uncharacterized protein n=1 Tax=Paspalum notatum var. saurae TaxID=547442 RepID=A0AAQ3TZ27_PASNO